MVAVKRSCGFQIFASDDNVEIKGNI